MYKKFERRGYYETEYLVNLLAFPVQDIIIVCPSYIPSVFRSLHNGPHFRTPCCPTQSTFPEVDRKNEEAARTRGLYISIKALLRHPSPQVRRYSNT